MKVKVGVSARHIHISEKDFLYLFGENHKLESYKDLKQKGEFASFDKVSIKSEKDTIDNVRVLGPIRKYTQVEVSKTDAIKLGINPPVRSSGDLKDSEALTICYKDKEIFLKNCCIIANRHIHINTKDSFKFGLYNNQVVKVKFDGIKGGTLDNVVVKTNDNYVLELHLDTDDANSHLIVTEDVCEVILDE